MSYKYITANNLFEKQNYMYSEYQGVVFLRAYMDSRKQGLGKLEESQKDVTYQIEMPGNPTKQALMVLCAKLEAEDCERKIMDAVNAYTKSFEVRKRIYTGYDDNWKPLEGAEFEDYECYLIFAHCLVAAYRCTKCLKYFSCLLKVDDTIISIQDKLTDQAKKYFGWIIKSELEIFCELAGRDGINWGTVE